MERKAYLFIMVGCPGSGKSYFLEDPDNLTANSVVISRDKIRYSLVPPENDYFSKEKLVFKEFIDQIQSNLDQGINVYADATHLNGVSRYKLLNALNLKDIGIIPIVFNTPLEVCFKRNDTRQGRARVPHTIIHNMYDSWTDPHNDEANMTYKYDDILYVDYKE